jgi:hypothetical protein
MQLQNKTLIKIIVVTVLAILFIFSVIKSLPQKSPKTDNSLQQIVIQGNKGEVQLKNFYNQVKGQVGDTMVLAETQDFHVVYFKKDQTFLITLLSQPVSNARDLAENEFLKQLEVDIGQACSLKVTVRVPYSVDSDLSGKDYGLSFCPNAVSF